MHVTLFALFFIQKMLGIQKISKPGTVVFFWGGKVFEDTRNTSMKF